MAHALETIEECAILREHPELTFQNGSYQYAIKRDGSRSLYSVTKGSETLQVPLGWAFGLGLAGQTYVYQYEGEYYESRVSFFKEVGGLDLTLGTIETPKSMVEALGRRMPAGEAVQCFACHSTNTVAAGKLDADHLLAGVQCERCHGSSEQHLQAFKTGSTQQVAMKKLGNMTAEQTSEFCGQCHRTWEQIAAQGPSGIGNVRFQPYRLTNSKCFDAEDPRISCVACHDPHQTLVFGNSAGYDAKCKACHTGLAGAKAKTCRTGQRDCAGCHMPRLLLPGSHHEFRDHQIRVVRANEPYPN